MKLIESLKNGLARRTIMVVHNDSEADEAYRIFGSLIQQNNHQPYSMQTNFQVRRKDKIYPFTIIVEGWTRKDVALICGDFYGDN